MYERVGTRGSEGKEEEREEEKGKERSVSPVRGFREERNGRAENGLQAGDPAHQRIPKRKLESREKKVGSEWWW